MSLFDQIDHAGLTDVGIKRSHNQDAIVIQKAVDREQWNQVGHIFLVADGMGGHAVGEKASAKAVRDIPLIYAKHVQDGVAAALRRAFQETNAAIHAIGQENQEFRGLGTTATGLIIRTEGAWIAHVGDSRVYRVRDGQIEQLSFDHSYVWEMARRLNVPPEELSDVKKNVIIRSLGPDPLVQVDIEGPYPLENGDIFILCSDGLSNVVTPEEIGSVCSVLTAGEATRFLTELANLRGGPDNISVIIVRIGMTEASTVVTNIKPHFQLKNWIWNLVSRTAQQIPWSLYVLMLGFLLALWFVVQVTNGNGSTFLFVVAALTILAGMVGLVMQSRKQQAMPEPNDEPPRLNVYRQFECQIQRGLLDKLHKMGSQLQEHLQNGKSYVVDWITYRALKQSSDKLLQEGDLYASFRDQCRALLGLARSFNQSRQKEEGFNPKFQNPFEK